MSIDAPKCAGRAPNIVELFWVEGPVYVDTAELARLGKTRLTMYTATGKRLSEAGRTRTIRERAENGIHRDNLYASLALAVADSEKMYAEFAQSFTNQGTSHHVA